jgi:hypothetical protein
MTKPARDGNYCQHVYRIEAPLCPTGGLSPASPAYHGRGEFRFTGEIDRVTIDLGDDMEGVGDFEPSD